MYALMKRKRKSAKSVCIDDDDMMRYKKHCIVYTFARHEIIMSHNNTKNNKGRTNIITLSPR